MLFQSSHMWTPYPDSMQVFSEEQRPLCCRLLSILRLAKQGTQNSNQQIEDLLKRCLLVSCRNLSLYPHIVFNRNVCQENPPLKSKTEIILQPE